ncbi:SGNH/GDSL hydrolase family protein [Marinobacter sp. 1-3A]|uniref:SGNH/GDSL hydrolase family protein n=1 Tax=Marinobacter sp. 1-3A TaxID=2582920 RepID=UPI001902EE29|nr:SGNH/GDSL hydrolase family protein [Marinobacter sp. 1-3A]MBK1874593.1 SGNH/GDSL hydrolase family protein [Marinobacter sp. 1-3A]
MRFKVTLLCLTFLVLSGCGGGDSSSSEERPSAQTPPPQVPLTYPSDGDSYKIAFIGNSITHHVPRKEIGWYGDWGMAASNLHGDYVHQLEDVFQHYKSEMVYQPRNVSAWERDYLGYEIDQLQNLQSFNADIIVVRLGENVPQVDINDDFRAHLKELIEYVDGTQSSPVIITDTFMPNPAMNEAIKTTAEEQNYTFCRISDLFDNIENTAVGQFENAGVARHPSDQGMYEISQRLFRCFQEARVFD